MVSNGLGVKNSMLIQHLFDVQPEAARFFLFMKIFMPRYNKNFDGYMLKLLVIFYLQSKNIFPSVQTIQKGLKKEIIDGNLIKFYSMIFFLNSH